MMAERGKTPPICERRVRHSLEKTKNPFEFVLLGLVSMFADMSTEMVYPLVPLFLTATLGPLPPS
jgi:hypothetical protein